jgi:hypothetical protein
VIDAAWLSVRDGDLRALPLYLRHYSARKARGPQPSGFVYGNHARFVGNGETMVLLTLDCRAVFAWRVQRHRLDDEHGVECSVFRNEGPVRSSELIGEACTLAWQRWPDERLFTFIDSQAIRSTNPGYCFLQAGFRRLKRRTQRGLRILERWPEQPAEA